MKKQTYFILIFIVLLSTLTGCKTSYNKPLSTVETDLLNTTKLDTMSKADEKALKRFFGLNINDFSEVLIYTPANYMDVSEMLIVTVKDPEQLEILESAVDERVLKQIESFSGYGPEQVALLENYEIKTLGNTLFYCVSPDASELKEAFKKSMKR